MRLAATLLVFLAVLHGAELAGAPAFANGEEFRFRVSWGVFRTAANLTVKANYEESDGKPRVRIQTETRTSGLIRAFYPFDGYSDCVFDGGDGRLLTAFAATKSSSKETNALATLDYSANVMRYEDRVDKSRTQDLPIPEGRPMDMITTLLTARTWNLKPGDKAEVVVMFDKDFYELTIYAERYEVTDTPNGQVEALVLTPKMERNPRGMFRRGGQVHVWVARDEQRLPVKLQVQLKYGTGTAYLTDYKPGAKAETGSVAAN
ncbi:DUF3108 domain-containing protein [Nibricoccus sp. IMCC34717]|uniref:DUF3108 domain-containing protein n=1 Tax=Nibricoccus sp. IMCC34717 TaxID=3034021 RepID=UPI00384F887C